MTILSMPLTNQAYGFPTRGHTRRVTPVVLAVVHITGNSGNMGNNAAVNERTYANRKNSPGPSAHYYVDRDGDAIHAIDESRFAAWSNGDMNKPATHNGGVQRLLNMASHGYNVNEGVYLETECVGTATLLGQWTDAQYETVAGLIARAAELTGMEINRETVLTHADINSVDRANCAFIASHREGDLSRLISLARGNDVIPAPVTSEAPKEITLPIHAAWYDLDGKTILDHSVAALSWRPSPYEVGALRAMYATVANKRRIVLVKPSAIRDVAVPAPVPIPDPAADAKGYARAREAASAIVATAAAEIAALLP